MDKGYVGRRLKVDYQGSSSEEQSFSYYGMVILFRVQSLLHAHSSGY